MKKSTKQSQCTAARKAKQGIPGWNGSLDRERSRESQMRNFSGGFRKWYRSGLGVVYRAPGRSGAVIDSMMEIQTIPEVDWLDL